MYQWEKIKENRLKGMSIKKLARTFKMSKNTVRKYLRSNAIPEMKKREFSSKADPFREEIGIMLKKEMIGTRIFEELKQKGFSGSQSSVHRYLQKTRKNNEPSKMTTRFETESGKQMQYDWKEWELNVGEKSVKVYIHSLILSFSRKKFYVASLKITTADILRAIYEGMTYFGGFSRELVIDNPKQMILCHRKDGVIRYNDNFLKFCGLFGIIPNPCENYWPQTKGKVERPFSYLQEHFLKGLEVSTWNELENRLADFNLSVNANYHRGIETTPDDRFGMEKASLISIPNIEPSAWIVKEIRKVSRDGYLSLGAKFYPVPMRLCGKELWIESVFGKQFRVYDNGKMVSEFPKRFEGPAQIPHPEHLKINSDFQESKRRKWSKPLIRFVELFGDKGTLFFEGVKSTQRENVYSHLNDILEWTQFYRIEDMAAVLDQCITIGSFHKNAVKKLLESKTLKTPSFTTTNEGSLYFPSASICRPLSVYKELFYV